MDKFYYLLLSVYNNKKKMKRETDIEIYIRMSFEVIKNALTWQQQQKPNEKKRTKTKRISTGYVYFAMQN